MQQRTLECPACEGAMERVQEPDLTFERCPACGGTFLDRGELNALATGSAGDIELCSIDPRHAEDDRFPTRRCPKCTGAPVMEKQHLLTHGDVVLDHCPSCGGWFLDGGELEQTNALLRELRSRGPEFRVTHRDRLVTLEKVTTFYASALGPLGGSQPATIEWDQVAAWYRRPLGVGLRVSPETWTHRLVKLFGAEDASTGDEEFDRTFRIEARDPEGARSVLGSEAREAIVDFHRSPLARLGRRQVFEVLDDRVVFRTTGWSDAGGPPPDERDRLFDALAGIAVAIDRG